MSAPFILSAISAAITPAVTAWPIPGGGGGAGSPLTSAAISSIAGSQTEGSFITIYASWVGGTAPFKVQYSTGATFNNVTRNSHSVNTIVVAGGRCVQCHRDRRPRCRENQHELLVPQLVHPWRLRVVLVQHDQQDSHLLR